MRVALVTGGNGGIGSAIVDSLEARGWRCAVLDLSVGDVGDLSLRVDVTDAGDVMQAVGRVEAELGPIEGVVACAGVVSEADLPDLQPDEWRRVVDVSLTGTYNLLRAVLPGMGERGGGAAVAISSGYGTSGYRRGGHYAAAKAGIEALVKSVAMEYGPSGVRVNAVAPGPVLTPFIGHIEDQGAWRRDREARIPLRRLAEPGDVADPVAFLLDDASRYVTGQVLHVNGGLLMP